MSMDMCRCRCLRHVTNSFRHFPYYHSEEGTCTCCVRLLLEGSAGHRVGHSSEPEPEERTARTILMTQTTDGGRTIKRQQDTKCMMNETHRNRNSYNLHTPPGNLSALLILERQIHTRGGTTRQARQYASCVEGCDAYRFRLRRGPLDVMVLHRPERHHLLRALRELTRTPIRRSDHSN